MKSCILYAMKLCIHALYRQCSCGIRSLVRIELTPTSLKPLDASTKSFLAKNGQDISLQMAHHHHFHPCSQVQPTTPRYSTFRRQWLQLQKWSNLVAGGYGPSQPVTPMPRNLDWFSPQRCFSEINPWLVLITLPTLKTQTKLKAETVPKRVWVMGSVLSDLIAGFQLLLSVLSKIQKLLTLNIPVLQNQGAQAQMALPKDTTSGKISSSGILESNNNASCQRPAFSQAAMVPVNATTSGVLHVQLSLKNWMASCHRLERSHAVMTLL